MLVFKNEKPKYGKNFEYKCPETGDCVISSNWPGLLYKIKEQRKKRQLPIPVGFFRMVRHNWCVDHPEVCKDENEPNVQRPRPASSKIPYPKLKDQLRSFLNDTTAWAKSGFLRTDRELVTKRLQICTDCEYWSGGSDFWNFRCRQCGCGMKMKVKRATSRCPVGRW